MQLIAPKLVASLFVVGTILSAAAAFAAEPKFSPESYLSRGAFRLAVFNRDETRLITATNELAQLWDLKTGALLQQFEGHAAPIHCVCFSPDERQVLTGAGKFAIHGPDDSTVRLWDVASGKQLAVFTTAGHPELDEFNMSIAARMISARFTPDEQQVLAVSRSRSTAIPDGAIFWNRKTQNMDLVVSGISTLSGVTHSYEPVQLSPDGRWFVGLYAEGLQVRAWDARTGELRWQVASPKHELEEKEQRGFGSLQVSPEGLSVLAACSDWSVRVWNGDTGREICALIGHTEKLRVARFSSSGKHVVTASGDGTVRLWDVQSGKQLQQWDYTDPVQEMSVSPDRKRLLTRTIRSGTSNVDYRWFGEIRDVKSGKSVRKWELPPMEIADNFPFYTYKSPIMSPSGRMVLTTVWANDNVEVMLLDAETGITLKRFE